MFWGSKTKLCNLFLREHISTVRLIECNESILGSLVAPLSRNALPLLILDFANLYKGNFSKARWIHLTFPGKNWTSWLLPPQGCLSTPIEEKKNQYSPNNWYVIPRQSRQLSILLMFCIDSLLGGWILLKPAWTGCHHDFVWAQIDTSKLPFSPSGYR